MTSLDGGSAAPATPDVPAKDRIISVRVTSKLGERLDQLAARRGWDVSMVVRDLVARATSTLDLDATYTCTAPVSEFEIRYEPDHSGVAGERSDSQKASESSENPLPTHGHSADPTEPAAAILAGPAVVSDETVEAAASADYAHGRFSFTGDPSWDGLPEVDRDWYRAAARVYLAAAAPLMPAQPDPDTERALLQVIEERDEAVEWADKLAGAIAAAAGVDIGEHSNLNEPWERALDAVPLLGAACLRAAYWKLREHASGLRSTEGYRRCAERAEYEQGDNARDFQRYRWLEATARGIEDAAQDIAEMLGVEECEIEPRADELERGAGVSDGR